jgi:uncharacterized protein
MTAGQKYQLLSTRSNYCQSDRLAAIRYYVLSQLMFELVQGTSAQQWIILFGVALMLGMSKTGVSGLGLMVVPLLAFGFGARESTGIMIPILIIADIYAVKYYHRSAEWKYIFKLLPWAIVGILGGVLTGRLISGDQFRMLLSGIVIAGLLIMVVRDFLKKDDSVPTHPAFGIMLGILGGFGSMVGNAAGPIFAVYLLAMRLPKNVYIGTGAWFYLIINLIKLPFHIWVWETISPGSLTLDLLAIPAILIGAWSGIRIIRLFSDGSYRIFVIIMTLLSALVLFFR